MIHSVRVFGTVHTVDCWRHHDECALSTAVSYLTARIAHDQARVKLYRQAGGNGGNAAMDDELRAEAIGFARRLLLDNETRDWSRAG